VDFARCNSQTRLDAANRSLSLDRFTASSRIPRRIYFAAPAPALAPLRRVAARAAAAARVAAAAALPPRRHRARCWRPTVRQPPRYQLPCAAVAAHVHRPRGRGQHRAQSSRVRQPPR